MEVVFAFNVACGIHQACDVLCGFERSLARRRDESSVGRIGDSVEI
jgi:hypothetical protein